MSSLLNLITISIIASHISLEILDFYFIAKDSTEAILKFFYVSTIGSFILASFKNQSLNYRYFSKVLFGFILIIIATYSVYLFFTIDIYSYFLGQKFFKLHLNFYGIQTALIVFAIFLWIDNMLTPLLVQRGFLQTNYISNLLSSLVNFLFVFLFEYDLLDVCCVFAISKIFSVLPKIFSIYINEKNNTNFNSLPIKDMIFFYLPSNIMMQFQKGVFLSATSFLAPGTYALYSLFYRYYTGLQNFITMNLFNLNLKGMTCDDDLLQFQSFKKLYLQHTVSFYFIIFITSVLLYSLSHISIYLTLPSFLTHPLTPVVLLLVVLNFYIDGAAFFLQKKLAFNGLTKEDSNWFNLQILLNIIVLYSFMKFFGILGLCYGTLIVCFINYIGRSIHFNIIFPNIMPQKDLKISIILWLVLVLFIVFYVHFLTNPIMLIVIASFSLFVTLLSAYHLKILITRTRK